MFFIANWKMFGDLKSVNSIKKVIKLSKNKKFNKAQIIYCPPYTLISNFVKLVKNSKIKIGAQNCHQSQNPGPFTGSINTELIKSSGANYIIIGHSENRATGDTNHIINHKIKAALKKNLKIIFCIGETLIQKKRNKTNSILKSQLTLGLKNIKNNREFTSLTKEIEYRNLEIQLAEKKQTQNDANKLHKKVLLVQKLQLQ